MELRINLPTVVKDIIRTLNAAGFDAYAVGGCVRDSVLGLLPGDWDVATSAVPLQVKGLFEKTVDTGIKHGTVTVIIDGEGFEVTTFRLDGAYEDFRHPSEVIFSSSLEEDLSRRDFTMNAMAWHPDMGIRDPFGGMRDISLGIIRTVGAAGARFREDALRMLRAVRFSARFGFTLQDDVLKGMTDNSSLIEKISCERIREELTGILVSDRPERLSLLMDTGILHHILPEVENCFKTPQNNPYHVFNVGEHSLVAAASIKNDPCLRWTMLMHDIGKPRTWTTDEKGIDHFHGHTVSSIELATAIMDRLKFDNKSIRRIIKLIKYHDTFIKPTCVDMRKAVSIIGRDDFPDLLKVKIADKMAQSPQFREKGLDYVKRLGFLYEETIKGKCCTSLGELEIDGHDLIEQGFEEGRRLKEILDQLLSIVIEDPNLNKRLKLIEIAQELRNI